jgi:hypothetical protein
LVKENISDKRRVQQHSSSFNKHKTTSAKSTPHVMTSNHSSSSFDAKKNGKFYRYCKKKGHDKSECFQLKKKSLLVSSQEQGANNAPIETNSDDRTYEELKGQLNKVTLMHHHPIQGG